MPATRPEKVTTPVAAEYTDADGTETYSIPRLPAHQVHDGARNESATTAFTGSISAHSAATNSINFSGTKT
ncbi:MAG: hypothetical protein RIS37_590 [Actinomycetota bacterium]